MRYKITRTGSAINTKLVGLSVTDILLILISPVFNLSWLIIVIMIQNTALVEVVSSLGIPAAGLTVGCMLSWSIWLLPIGCILLRWVNATGKGSRADEEWERFINQGMDINFQNLKTTSSSDGIFIPSLDKNSGPAMWLETVNLAFCEPVTMNLPNANASVRFAEYFERLMFERVQSNATSIKSDNPAFGRVFIHGKNYSLIFRQPDGDSIVLFLYRMEVVGTVASLICGGRGFIRRTEATGEKARRKRMSDDQVYAKFITESNKVDMWTMCVPGIGILSTLRIIVGDYMHKFILADLPYSWIRFGELGAYREIDREISLLDWDGIKPDRTSLTASIDYLTKMAQNEILKEAHLKYLNAQSVKDISNIGLENTKSRFENDYL
jgi:hypothetical protein